MRGNRESAASTAKDLERAAAALEARASDLRAEAARFRAATPNAVGDEQRKASMLMGVQSLADAAQDVTAHAHSLAAAAHGPKVGVSSRMLASALGVSTNTAIKRIRNATREESRDDQH